MNEQNGQHALPAWSPRSHGAGDQQNGKGKNPSKDVREMAYQVKSAIDKTKQATEGDVEGPFLVVPGWLLFHLTNLLTSECSTSNAAVRYNDNWKLVTGFGTIEAWSDLDESTFGGAWETKPDWEGFKKEPMWEIGDSVYKQCGVFCRGGE